MQSSTAKYIIAPWRQLVQRDTSEIQYGESVSGFNQKEAYWNCSRTRHFVNLFQAKMRDGKSITERWSTLEP